LSFLVGANRTAVELHLLIPYLAGNNEGKKFIYLTHLSFFEGQGFISDYQIAESCGLELDYSDEVSDFRKTNFPARYIYERVLPKVVNELCDIHYHRGSPYSGHGKPTVDRNYGDLHQCEKPLLPLCSLIG